MSMLERVLWPLVERGPRCWLWRGRVWRAPGGKHAPEGRQYGVLYAKGEKVLAHRVVARVPVGRRLFPLCMTALCVRPSHWGQRGAPLPSARADRAEWEALCQAEAWMRQQVSESKP